jgi:hypothetical protein
MADNSYSYPAAYITAVLDISGANTVTLPIVPIAFQVTRLNFHVGVVTATAAETITVKKNPIPAATTSAVTLGTFSVAAGLAAGAEVRINVHGVAGFDLNAGEQLDFTCGNSTGTGSIYVVAYGYHLSVGPTPQVSFSATTKTEWAGVSTIQYAAFTAA